MFRLFCEGDPIQLGITRNDGSWDMVTFRQHLEQCEVCHCAMTKLRRRLEDRLRKDLAYLMRVSEIE